MLKESIAVVFCLLLAISFNYEFGSTFNTVSAEPIPKNEQKQQIKNFHSDDQDDDDEVLVRVKRSPDPAPRPRGGRGGGGRSRGGRRSSGSSSSSSGGSNSSTSGTTVAIVFGIVGGVLLIGGVTYCLCRK